MTITVNGPDGATYNFPDETPPDEMTSALAKVYPNPTPAPPAAAAPGVMAGVSRALEANLPFVDRAVAAAKGGDYATNLATERAKNAQFAEQNPWTNAIGGITAYAPAALIPGGAGLAGRVGTGALTGFGLGGIQGASNSPDLTNTQETGRSIAEGELSGGALGGAFPAVASAIGSAFSRGPIDQARQALVQSLKDAGIKPTAGQITGNQGLQKLEASISDIPFGGGGAEVPRQANAKAFTQAILAKAGFPGVADASPESLNAAHEALGAQFDALGARNAILPDAQFAADMTKAVNDYHNVTGTPAPGISKFVEGINGPTPSDVSGAAVSGAVESRDAPSRPQVPAGPAPTPMLDFIRRAGGLKDEGGDLASMGFSNLKGVAGKGSSKIIDKENGLPMDEARRMAVESGYMEPHETVSDFINKLGEHPTYSQQDEEAVAARAAKDAFNTGPKSELGNPANYSPSDAQTSPVVASPPTPRIILGEEYNNFRSQLGKTAQKLRFTDPAQAEAYRGVQDALDSAMERSIAATNPNDLGAFQAVRQKYKNLLPIEHAAGSAGADAAIGIISPQQMRTALAAGGNRRSYARGIGDLAPLTNAGNAILTNFPQSGTAPRTMMAHSLQGIGALAGGLGGATGGVEGAGLGATAGAIALPALAGRAVMSGPGQAFLTNMLAKRLPAAQSTQRPLSRAAMAAALAANAGLQGQHSQATQP